MNRWLTWRARLEHLFNPANECLCHVCSQARVRSAKERSTAGWLFEVDRLQMPRIKNVIRRPEK